MEFTIIPRARWTKSKPGGAVQDADDQEGVAVHWPGSTTDRYGSMTESRVVSLLNGWRDYHMNVRGWSDIGYNYAIDSDGRIWELRGMNRVGAHSASDENPTANDKWVGVLFILGDEEPVPSIMVQAFRWLRQRILAVFPKGTLVRGHGQIAGAETECPGPFVRAVMGLLDDVPVVGVPSPDSEEDDMEKVIYRLGRSVHFRIFGDQAVNMPAKDVEIHTARGYRVIGVTAEYANNLRSTLRFEGDLDASVSRELENPTEPEE